MILILNAHSLIKASQSLFASKLETNQEASQINDLQIFSRFRMFFYTASGTKPDLIFSHLGLLRSQLFL